MQKGLHVPASIGNQQDVEILAPDRVDDSIRFEKNLLVTGLHDLCNDHLPILFKDVEFVVSVERGYMQVDGSPGYAAQNNDFMSMLQSMLT